MCVRVSERERAPCIETGGGQVCTFSSEHLTPPNPQSTLQGYLAHQQQRPPRTLQKDYAWGPTVVLGEGGLFLISLRAGGVQVCTFSSNVSRLAFELAFASNRSSLSFALFHTHTHTYTHAHTHIHTHTHTQTHTQTHKNTNFINYRRAPGGQIFIFDD